MKVKMFNSSPITQVNENKIEEFIQGKKVCHVVGTASAIYVFYE